MVEIVLPYPEKLITEYPGGERQHQGIDYGVPTGTPVPAPFAGTVVFAGNDGSGSLTVDVVSSDGLLARHGHNSEILVSVGDRVRVGQTLALSGNTGWSTGPHVHLEFRRDRLWNGGDWLTWADIQKLVKKPAKPKRKPAKPLPAIIRKRRREHMFIYCKIDGKTHYGVFALGVKGSWTDFIGQKSANQLATQYGNAMEVSPGYWSKLKKQHS